MPFHINPETGNSGKCSAQAGNCPFGGEDIHFSTAEDARKAYESSMEGNTWPTQAQIKVKRQQEEMASSMKKQADELEKGGFSFEAKVLRNAEVHWNGGDRSNSFGLSINSYVLADEQDEFKKNWEPSEKTKARDLSESDLHYFRNVEWERKIYKALKDEGHRLADEQAIPMLDQYAGIMNTLIKNRNPGWLPGGEYKCFFEQRKK